MEDTVRQALAKYGVKSPQLMQPATGYRNWSYPCRTENGEILNLILYKREPGTLELIRRTNAVGNFVASRGLPARRTDDDRIIVGKNQQATRFFALYNYLPGATIAWEAYTTDHIKLLGQSLSFLHETLSNYREGDLPDVIALNRQLLEEMRTYFKDLGVIRAMQDKLGVIILPSTWRKMTHSLASSSHISHKQALHMDFVRGNILYDTASVKDDPRFCRGNLAVTGILDFEKAAFGPLIFDVARTLAFLIVDCKYKPPRKVLKYFFNSGYCKHGSQITSRQNIDIAALLSLVQFFMLHDFYKFLRHNPYESLQDNEHYQRTKHFLLQARLITMVK